MTEAKKKVAKKKTATASPEAVVDSPVEVVDTSRVAAQVAVGSHHKVRNKSEKLINTSKGSIPPGETGMASTAECRQLSKWLEKI